MFFINVHIIGHMKKYHYKIIKGHVYTILLIIIMNYHINIFVIIILKMNIKINFVMAFFVKKIIIKMRLIHILSVMEMLM